MHPFIRSVNCVVRGIKRVISSLVSRGDVSRPIPDHCFVRRLDPDEVSIGVERILGRRLTSFENALLERRLRPLRDADDSLVIRVASPRYEGRAPLVVVTSLAVDGYAAAASSPLQLVESALVFREAATLEDDVVDLVA